MEFQFGCAAVSGAFWAASCRPPAAFWGFLELSAGLAASCTFLRLSCGFLGPAGVSCGFASLAILKRSAAFSAFWCLLGLSGASCGFLVPPGAFCCFLGPPAASWGLLRLSGSLLRLSEVSCGFLGPAGVSAAFSGLPRLSRASCGFLGLPGSGVLGASWRTFNARKTLLILNN